MNDSIVVAYCTNAAMAMPMRVSAYALLHHLNPDTSIELHLLQEGWSPAEKEQLRQILEQSGRKYTLTIQDADLTPFASLRALHGDRTAYARLLLPDLINAERILYLDSDTLPLIDVSQIYNVELDGQIMGAVAWNMNVSMALDRTVLLAEGIPAEESYFNSGVLLMDAECFRTQGIYRRCMETARRLEKRLVSHDQTLLNLVLHGEIKPLRWGYNVRLGHDAPFYEGEGLAHFVGALKPWDPLGRWLHGNALLWFYWARRAGENVLPLSHQWRRAMRLRSAYANAFRVKLTSGVGR